MSVRTGHKARWPFGHKDTPLPRDACMGCFLPMHECRGLRTNVDQDTYGSIGDEI